MSHIIDKIMDRDFGGLISYLSLQFRDATTEQEYQQQILTLSRFKRVLLIRVLLIYAAIMTALMLYYDISLIKNGIMKKAAPLTFAIVFNGLIVLLETLLSLCHRARKFRGIASIFATYSSYAIFLEAADLVYDSPPGDFALVAVVTVIGMTLCYSWYIFAGTYCLAVFFFFGYLNFHEARNQCKLWPQYSIGNMYGYVSMSCVMFVSIAISYANEYSNRRLYFEISYSLQVATTFVLA